MSEPIAVPVASDFGNAWDYFVARWLPALEARVESWGADAVAEFLATRGEYVRDGMNHGAATLEAYLAVKRTYGTTSYERYRMLYGKPAWEVEYERIDAEGRMAAEQ